MLGLSELATDSRFRINADRVVNRDILVPLLEDCFIEKTRKEWVDLLDGKGFPMGPLRSVSEAFKCEQAIHRGMVEESDHPVAGKIRLPRSPISFSRPKIASNSREENEEVGTTGRLPPPMLGEHTEEILGDMLRMSPREINQLERNGVVECYRNDSKGR
jgi:formyl-CoA transferase